MTHRWGQIQVLGVFNPRTTIPLQCWAFNIHMPCLLFLHMVNYLFSHNYWCITDNHKMLVTSNTSIFLLLLSLQTSYGLTDVSWLLWAWLQVGFRPTPHDCCSFGASKPPRTWSSHREVQDASPSGQEYFQLANIPLIKASHMPMPTATPKESMLLMWRVGSESCLNRIQTSTLPHSLSSFLPLWLLPHSVWQSR